MIPIFSLSYQTECRLSLQRMTSRQKKRKMLLKRHFFRRPAVKKIVHYQPLQAKGVALIRTIIKLLSKLQLRQNQITTTTSMLRVGKSRLNNWAIA